MQLSRHIILSIVALCVLNASMVSTGVRADDFQLDTSRATINELNEYETLVEFIAEEVANYEDFIPEDPEQNDHQDGMLKKANFSIVAVRQEKTSLLKPELKEVWFQHLSLLQVAGTSRGFLSNFYPPPDIV